MELFDPKLSWKKLNDTKLNVSWFLIYFEIVISNVDMNSVVCYLVTV